MANGNGGAVPMQPRNALPIVGQRFVPDVPAGQRKVPEGTPMGLVLLYSADKEQLDRLEQKLDRLLGFLEPGQLTDARGPEPKLES